MNAKALTWGLTLAWFAVMVGLAVVIVKTGRFGGSLTAFLPTSGNTVQRALVQGLHKGEASRVLMAAVSGGSAVQRLKASRALVGLLRPHKAVFALVANGGRGAARDVEGFLSRYRYLLAPRTAWTVGALRVDLQRDLAILESPAGLTSGEIMADPTGALMAAARPWMGGGGPRSRHGEWESRDGRSALLLMETHRSGFSVTPQRRALHLIHAAFTQVARGTPLTLTMAGTGVVTVAANDRVAASAKVLTVIDLFLVAGILFFVYRSAPPMVASLVPLTSGAMVATAVTALAFPRLAITTLGFGTMLIGVAMDYPTYVLLHMGPGEGARAAARRVARALGLAMIAMVIGFSTMIVSRLAGLVQLGVFACAGLVASALAARYLLPFMMPAWRPTADLSAWDRRASRAISGLRRARWVSAVVALGGLGVLGYRGSGVWDDHLSALSPAPHVLMARTGRMAGEFGVPGLSSLVVVSADNTQQALARSAALIPVLERLRKGGMVASYQLAAGYLPTLATQRRRQQALPAAAVLQRRLRAAAAHMPFRARAFRPFLAAVQLARHEPLLRPEDVPAPVRARLKGLLMRVHGRVVAFVRLSGVHNPRRVHAMIRASHVEGAHFVVVKRVVGALMGRYRAALLKHSIVAALLMALVLAIGLRSAREALRLVLPMAAAILTTSAILVLMGPGLTLLNLVALLLIAGLGMGYALFLGDHGLITDRRPLAPWICAATTITGFGVMAFASVAMLRQVGLTVSIGALLALIFTAAWSSGRGRTAEGA